MINTVKKTEDGVKQIEKAKEKKEVKGYGLWLIIGFAICVIIISLMFM